MGTKDTPAVIDMILKVTGHQKINYVGHSEGGSQFFAGASLMPDYYKSKLNVAVLLGPAISMKNNKLLILNILSIKLNRVILESLMDTIRLWNIIPYNYATNGAASLFCNLFDGRFCNLLMAIFTNEDPTVDYTQRFDTYMSFLPSGAGYRNIIHYA